MTRTELRKTWADRIAHFEASGRKRQIRHTWPSHQPHAMILSYTT